MMAGAAGATPPDFFARSAIVARYAKLAWRRRIHSTYSRLGFCVGPLAASAAWSDVGDGLFSCDACWLGGPPALPAACRLMTSCSKMELISRRVETRAFSRAAAAGLCAAVGTDPCC